MPGTYEINTDFEQSPDGTLNYLIPIPNGTSAAPNNFDLQGLTSQSPAYQPAQAPVVLNMGKITPISGNVLQYLFATNVDPSDSSVYVTLTIKNIQIYSPGGNIGGVYCRVSYNAGLFL